MRYLKSIGLALMAGTALMAFAGSAFATTLTSPAGTTVAVGTKVKASSEGALEKDLKPGKPTCQKANFEGEVTRAGGASETVGIALSSLTFTECVNLTISVLNPGSLEIHTSTESADGNGTVTWSGAEITFTTHNILLGTTHCVYYTESTHIGTLAGSKNREGKTATLDLEAADLPLRETDPLCDIPEEGEEEGEQKTLVWTGSFTFGTPDYLDVD